MSKHALCSWLLVAALVLGASPAGASAASPQSGDSVELKAEEVLLDLIVTDGKGNPVTDLKPEEVEVFEEGKRQELTSFSLVGSGIASTAGQKAPAAIELSPFRGFNFVILVIDRTSVRQTNLTNTYQAAEKFVNERLQPNDLVAVFVAANRLVMLQNFTNSKPKLLDAMRAATDAGSNVVGIDRNEGAVQTIIEPPPQTAASATDVFGSALEVSQQLSSLANGLDSNFSALVDQFQATALVYDLLALIQTYSGIPGRKSVLLYSEGFAVDSAVERSFASVIGAANRGNFTFYTVDAAGLRTEGLSNVGPSRQSIQSTNPRGGDRTLADIQGNSGLGQAEKSVRTLANAPLHRIAVETGGVPLRNSNDLGRGFEAVESDLRSYYALSYSPGELKLDGKFREVSVKVTRKGVDVRTRRGYFAVPNGSGSLLLPYEQPILEMLASATPQNRPNAIPTLLRIERFPSAGKWQSPIVMTVEGSSLAPTKVDEKGVEAYDFEFDAVAVIRDARNTVVAKLSRSNLYRAQKSDLEQFQALTLLSTFNQPLVLDPGAYKLSVGIYDPNANKGTVIERAFTIPKSMDGAPMLSSIVTSREVQPSTASTTDPFMFDKGTRIVPNTSGKFVKSKGDRLVVFFKLTGQPGKQYQVKMEFVKDGQVVTASQPTALPVTNAAGETAFAPTIPINGLAPGAYIANIVILDAELGKAVASGTATFRVDE